MNANTCEHVQNYVRVRVHIHIRYRYGRPDIPPSDLQTVPSAPIMIRNSRPDRHVRHAGSDLSKSTDKKRCPQANQKKQAPAEVAASF